MGNRLQKYKNGRIFREETMKILIKNGKIWDGECFFNGDVLTDGNKISCIADHIEENATFVYDASGKIVSAGLIDIHTHLKGVSEDKFGIDASMCTFPFGVTTAADASGNKGDKTKLLSLNVKNFVFVAAPVKDNQIDFLRLSEKLKIYGEKAIGVKLFFDTHDKNVWDINPLKQLCDFAKENNLKVMVHSSYSPVPMSDIINTLSKGDIVTHTYHGGVHSCKEEKFACFETAKKRGVYMDIGFAGHVHTDFDVLKSAFKAKCFPDTISTDITCLSAYVRGGKYGMTMCMSMAKEAGISEKDVFKACTAMPAKVLNIQSGEGYLKVDGPADIAVLDYCDEGFDLTDAGGNRLQSDKGYRCYLTIADGQIVYRC